MKSIYLKAAMALCIGFGTVSCGDDFLDTKIYNGVDLDKGLSTVPNIENALNGAYYRLFYYPFAGNFSLCIGDIASDVAYWNGVSSHQDAFYRFAALDTDITLEDIWNYGYKVIDNSSRVIDACPALYEGASADEKVTLDMCSAEAYALRAYATWNLVNIFGHQIKCNGQDYSSEPGIVVVEHPVPAYSKVERATVGETYAAILKDLNSSIEYFNKAGEDKGTIFYFTPGAVYGLMARVNLYMENWNDAYSNAKKALEVSGKTVNAYTGAAYKALYNGGESNTESIFALDINSRNNWSANSCGSQWSTYDYSPSPWLQSIFESTDVRTSIMAFEPANDGTPSNQTSVPVYEGGKFGAYASGNPAYAANYLINAPEMYLIMAEAKLKTNDLNGAKDNLLVVAKRNTAIASVSDLPASAADVMQFIKDERARELFQEGHRLYDLRRWAEKANVYAYNSPEIKYTFTNYDISKFVFPIPAAEINAGFGVTQTPGWSDALPQ